MMDFRVLMFLSATANFFSLLVVNFYAVFFCKIVKSCQQTLYLDQPNFFRDNFWMNKFWERCVACWLELFFFNASVQAFEVFDLTPITHRNRLNVSTATKRYLTPNFAWQVVSCQPNQWTKPHSANNSTLSLGKRFLVSLNFV